MGWLRDLWRGVVTWVRDIIIEPIVDWVKQLIEDTRAWIKIWKHEMRGLLATWLENDWFFLAVVAGVIALALFFPAIKEWAGKLTITLMLKAAWEDVKDGFAEILDFIHIIELDTINTILKIVWPDYREAMGELTTVASALAVELGEGSGYIQAAFGVVHGLAIVENAFLGTDPKLAELGAFEDTAEGLARVSEKFREYAYNPGLIWSDIINDFYLPRAENIRIAQQGVIDSARDSRDKIVGINLALHDFSDRLEHFIEMSPEELEAIIDERLGPFAEALADGLYVMDTEVMPKINGIIDALALREERQQEINDNVLARISDPYQLLLQAEFMRNEDREALENYIAELEGRAEDREVELIMQPALAEIEHEVVSALIPATTASLMPSLGYEPAGAAAPAVSPEAEKRDWLVGEF